jgi:hypothetical protein
LGLEVPLVLPVQTLRQAAATVKTLFFQLSLRLVAAEEEELPSPVKTVVRVVAHRTTILPLAPQRRTKVIMVLLATTLQLTKTLGVVLVVALVALVGVTVGRVSLLL